MAKLIDGKKISAAVKDSVRAEINSLKEKGIGINFSDKVYEYIADSVNTEKRGAREIRNVIRKP